MTKSAKSKKEKKKDFQKPKLRVGKSKPKGTNVTDTSFRSKTISVLHQSLSATAPSASSLFVQRLSLLTHKSPSQRQESLSNMTKFLCEHKAYPLPQPSSLILAKVLPLLVDPILSVREQAAALLAAIPGEHITYNVETIILHTRLPLTHLSDTVKLTGLDVMDWLLDVAGLRAVECPGGWLGMLKVFMVLLRWKEETKSVTGWTTLGAGIASAAGRDEQRLLTRKLEVLAKLLEYGFSDVGDKRDAEELLQLERRNFPIKGDAYLLPRHPDPYGYLDLYGPPKDDVQRGYRSLAERRRVYEEYVSQAVISGVERVKRVGGSVGRAAVKVEKNLPSLNSSYH